MSDVFDFIHSEKTSAVNIALIAMFQLFFFRRSVDGNGRVVRAFVVSFLQKEIGVILAYILMLYFKVINPKDYYSTLQHYREGDLTKLKNFHSKAIEWAKLNLTGNALASWYLNNQLYDVNYSDGTLEDFWIVDTQATNISINISGVTTCG